MKLNWKQTPDGWQANTPGFRLILQAGYYVEMLVNGLLFASEDIAASTLEDAKAATERWAEGVLERE